MKIDEKTIRDWFGAVREASDAAVKKLEEYLTVSASEDGGSMPEIRKVKAQILFRQYLCDRLQRLVRDADGFQETQTETIREKIYSELMEDAVAGIWSEMETMEMTMFLYECTQGVDEPDVFAGMLRKAAGEDIPKETAADLAEVALKKMEAFAAKRKERRTPARQRRDDEPPPGMDEFEYIDWVMTH